MEEERYCTVTAWDREVGGVAWRAYDVSEEEVARIKNDYRDHPTCEIQVAYR